MDVDIIHIHRPRSYNGRTIIWCNSCGWRKRAIVSFYEYYEPSVTCCTCGHDPRDRAKKRINKFMANRAKEEWKNATTHKQAIQNMIDDFEKT